MHLKKLKLKNFRCYKDFEIDNIGKLVVFIGENDAGKTVLLNAIQWLLSEKACDDADCREDENGKTAETVVEGVFKIEKGFDELDEKYLSGGDGDELHIRKIHTAEGTRIYYIGRGYTHSFNDFSNAAKQTELLKKLGEKPAKTDEGRRKQRQKLVESGKIQRTEGEAREIKPLDYKKLLEKPLPEVRSFSASKYKSADSIVQSKLRDVAKSLFESEIADEELKPHLESLQAIKSVIRQKLKSEIEHIKPTLKKYHQEIKDINAEIEIQFENAVGTSALMLDLGNGERLLEQFGDGTKRRLWMGLLEWETETKNEKSSRSVIRLYDEPDVNLHYRAQQQFFENIVKTTENEDIHAQCFVSTHSFSMVDRAPSESLVLIRVGENGERDKRQLQSLPENDDYFDFKRDLAAAGLSNSALLYESGFLLVEGHSEDVAIPIFYQKVHGRTLVEDGIKLIKMDGSGNWRTTLKTLLGTRKDAIHLLLDNDCRKETKKGNQKQPPQITQKALEELNIDADFINRQVTFIGENEFEDAFEDDVLIAALKNNYIGVDSRKWQKLDLTALRKEDKFSEAFLLAAGEILVEFKDFRKSKPKFAKNLADYCPKEQIPNQILQAFKAIRSQIGIPN